MTPLLRRLVYRPAFFTLLSLLFVVSTSHAQRPGSLDMSFNASDKGYNFGGYLGTIYDIEELNNGKVLIAGSLWRNITDSTQQVIYRLNNDGTIDTTFKSGFVTRPTQSSSYVYALAVQADNKIIIGGDFANFDGMPYNGIARLNIDGSLDTTFKSNITYSSAYVEKLIIQNDGKILAVGYFSFNSGQGNSSIITRMHADGSLDSTFAIEGYSGGSHKNINTLSLMPDGKIIIGGHFDNFKGKTFNSLARLNPDGSLDTTFNIGAGVNDNIKSLALQTDGNIIIGGSFTSYDGIGRNRIARIYGGGSLPVSVPALDDSKLKLFPNPSSGSFILDLSDYAISKTAQLEIYNLVGQRMLQQTITTNQATNVNMHGLADGTYIVKVSIDNKILVQKIVLQR